MINDDKLTEDIKISVARSLLEDIGDGDITAQYLFIT